MAVHYPTWETPEGKQITLFSEGFGLRAKFVQGGELPAELGGIWTSIPSADTSMRMYIARKLEETPKSKKYKPELNKEDYSK